MSPRASEDFGPRYNPGDDVGPFVPQPWDEDAGRAVPTPVVVVTRHDAVVKWLVQRGYPVYAWVDEKDLEDGGWNRVKRARWEVISHVTDPAQVAGKVVVGALPLHLAAEAYAVGAIDMPALRQEQRGKELSLPEMVEAGATLNWYRVAAIQEPPLR